MRLKFRYKHELDVENKFSPSRKKGPAKEKNMHDIKQKVFNYPNKNYKVLN